MKRPLMPVGELGAESESGDDLPVSASRARVSSSATLVNVERCLDFGREVLAGDTIGGTITSNDGNAPGGGTFVSIRTMRKRLLGAGLHGLVCGRTLRTSIASSLSHR